MADSDQELSKPKSELLGLYRKPITWEQRLQTPKVQILGTLSLLSLAGYFFSQFVSLGGIVYPIGATVCFVIATLCLALLVWGFAVNLRRFSLLCQWLLPVLVVVASLAVYVEMRPKKSIQNHAPLVSSPSGSVEPKNLSVLETTPKRDESIIPPPKHIRLPKTVAAGPHQSFIDNYGTIGKSTIINSSINGTPDSTKTGPIISNHGSIGDLRISDAHICNLASWGEFLDCVEARSGNKEGVEAAVNSVRTMLNSINDQNLYPEQCRVAVDQAFRTISSNVSEEHGTVIFLKKNVPYCLKR